MEKERESHVIVRVVDAVIDCLSISADDEGPQIVTSFGARGLVQVVLQVAFQKDMRADSQHKHIERASNNSILPSIHFYALFFHTSHMEFSYLVPFSMLLVEAPMCELHLDNLHNTGHYPNRGFHSKSL